MVSGRGITGIMLLPGPKKLLPAMDGIDEHLSCCRVGEVVFLYRCL